jgi:hypothetical protein
MNVDMDIAPILSHAMNPMLRLDMTAFRSSPHWTLILFWSLLSAVVAQSPQAILWNTPVGDLQDFSQTFNNGETLLVSWNAWTSDTQINATTSLVDLWVTSFDYSVNQYSYKIISMFHRLLYSLN